MIPPRKRRDTGTEGDGGSDGIVLPLQVVGSGVYDIAYTLPVSVGSNSQKLYLQVDTGSSDLWIASKSCTTSSTCGQTSGHLYDPSVSSTSTDKDFKINYLQGEVSGPIVWDQVVVGGYSIDNQALAAATSITSEPLSPYFSGILGLALPLNSIISSLIAPTTSNAPDGAAWASNVFSITPISSAPQSRFLSLLLSRPGSGEVPAQIGIGRHPEFISQGEGNGAAGGGVDRSGDVEYDLLESERSGTLFWKVSVRAITVWVNGQPLPVSLGGGSDGGVWPSAVLDTGVPVILTTSQVANGIYGALGVGPGSDGYYYVPCTTPLNLTISLDSRSPIPLHPLDLTAITSASTSTCVGLIQSADSVLGSSSSSSSSSSSGSSSGIGDMILGVPFLRNVYTVMAYEPPSTDGTFPSTNKSGGDVTPRLGLLGITDPTKALQEFTNVRVYNQPLSSSSPSSGSGSSSSSSSNGSGSGDGLGGKKISVGLIVLAALLGFFALCMALFGVRWWVARRRYRKGGAGHGAGGAVDVGMKDAKDGMRMEVLNDIGRATLEKDSVAAAGGGGGWKYARTSTRGSRDEDNTMDTLAPVTMAAVAVVDLGTKKKMVDGGKELFKDEETMRNGRWEAYMDDFGVVDLGLGVKPSTTSRDDHDHGHDDDDDHDDEGEHREDGEVGYRGRARGGGGGDEEWGDEDPTLVSRNNVLRPQAHERTNSTSVPLLQSQSQANEGEGERPMTMVSVASSLSRYSGESEGDSEKMNQSQSQSRSPPRPPEEIQDFGLIPVPVPQRQQQRQQQQQQSPPLASSSSSPSSPPTPTPLNPNPNNHYSITPSTRERDSNIGLAIGSPSDSHHPTSTSTFTSTSASTPRRPSRPRLPSGGSNYSSTSTSNRSPPLNPTFSTTTTSSSYDYPTSPPPPPPPLPLTQNDTNNFPLIPIADEFGFVPLPNPSKEGSMAGIGTAARTRRRIGSGAGSIAGTVESPAEAAFRRMSGGR